MSREILVYHYDAFSNTPEKGNPAGVVLEAQHLSNDEMRQIARIIGFNETVFVLQSGCTDIQLRYFTPGHEIDLCGHATMASLAALCEWGSLVPHITPLSLTIETKAGILPVEIDRANDGSFAIRMEQVPAQFFPFEGDREKLAAVLGLEPEDISKEHPIVYGSTGIWTLITPLTGLGAMRRMTPDTASFPKVLADMPRASIHLFCIETYDPSAQIHGRHFSSPFSGTVEDPVTGTASGVLGAYFVKYIQTHQSRKDFQFVVEQGQEIGKDGRVFVEVSKTTNNLAVKISGTACYVKKIRLTL